MTKKEFKLKNPNELIKIIENPNITELVTYIEDLHDIIRTYQIVIDQAVSKRVKLS